MSRSAIKVGKSMAAGHVPGAPRAAEPVTMSKADYLEQLLPLQYRLNLMARWLEQTGGRLLVILEGRDTAGKGGTINALSERLNPRRCHVVALDAPSEREQGEWYFQRYVPHLPRAGEIALFDRSWYNRAGVEAVMGYCTTKQTKAFLAQAPKFERLLADDGVMIFKYWLCVDQAEQEQRFAERLADPLKRWKLSPIDLEARTRYAEYGKARDRMIAATHAPHAPWALVDFNDQRQGRITLIRHLLGQLPQPILHDETLVLPPLEGRPLRDRIGSKLRPLQVRAPQNST